MNKSSFIIIFPALLLVLGAVFATFYHKYDINRSSLPSMNLTFRDLEGLAGNIISLQKDSTGTVVSIVSGTWQFNKSAPFTSGTNNKTIEFQSNLTSYKADGMSTNKLSLSNFTLARLAFTDKNATLDGTASFKIKGKVIEDNTKSSNAAIPLHMVLSNKLAFAISSDSDLFQKYFQKSPVYGKVTYSPMVNNETNKSSVSKTSGVSTQFAGGPVTVDPALKVELVTGGIKFPSHMAFLGNNDLLVLEKNEGVVKRVLNGVIQNDSLLDATVANGVERGMLGIAVKKTNIGPAHVFLYFTESVKDGDDLSEGKIP